MYIFAILFWFFATACSSSDAISQRTSETEQTLDEQENDSQFAVEADKRYVLNGVVWHDRNKNGKRDNIRLIFAVDASNSTLSKLKGETTIGDPNNDGRSDTIFDAEFLATINSLKKLYEIQKKNPDQKIEVAISKFFYNCQYFDLDPLSSGIQKFVSIEKIDAIVSVVRKELSILETDPTFTNFAAPLSAALTTIQESKNRNNFDYSLLFITDGFHNASVPYLPPLEKMQSQGIKINAISLAVPPSLSLEDLDKNWRNFANFGDFSSHLNMLASSLLEPILSDIKLQLSPILVEGKKRALSARTNNIGQYRFVKGSLLKDSVLQVAYKHYKIYFPAKEFYMPESLDENERTKLNFGVSF